MLFGGYDYSCLFRCPDDGHLIDRLYRVQIQDPRFVCVFAFQDPRRTHGFGNHGSAGDDRQVFAFVLVFAFQHGLKRVGEAFPWLAEANHVRFADHERRFLPRHHRRRFARKADVLGPFVSSSRVRVALRVSTASQGTTTVMFGSPHMANRSSSAWCVAPSGPTETPPCAPAIITLNSP